eukprot:30228-Pelagococcus_subviridis.AAC.3
MARGAGCGIPERSGASGPRGSVRVRGAARCPAVISRRARRSLFPFPSRAQVRSIQSFSPIARFQRLIASPFN